MKTIKNNHRIFMTNAGFTLVEMLIVIIILGILAMIIVPQISVSSDDAKLSTLQSNLATMRNAVELYYAQHDNTFPGENTIAGAASESDANSQTAFVQQLTRYTDIDGTVGATKTTDIKYGPYLRGGDLPTNPFDADSDNDVTCDYDQGDITHRTSTNNSAWRFFPATGVLIANDNAAHAAY